MNIRANAYYRLNGASAGAPSNPFDELLAALATSIQGVTGGKFGLQQGQSSSVLGPGITDLLQRQTDQSTGSTRPKAFLNWVLLDEQFKIVNTSTGFEPVGADGEFKTFVKTGLPISQNGYLYVYTSNESPVDVFFDNLQVTHVRGPLLEETHYYPFGLTMAGISTKAAGSLENRKKFNGCTELNTDFNLNWYETNYRALDPQLGRFWQLDPLADISVESSPFSYANNNPILLNDPLGLVADSTDKKGNVWHGLPDVTVTSRKKSASKTFNQFADFGFSLGWNSRIRINNYVNVLANAKREYEAGSLLLEEASWLRYSLLVKSREQLTLSGKFMSQLFKSNRKAYQDYLKYLEKLNDKNFKGQLSVFTPNKKWTTVARYGQYLGPLIQIGAEFYEYKTIISEQKTIDQVEDDYDSWFNPVMKLWRPIEDYLKTLGPKK